jgi:hypothetical protein
MKKYAIIDVTTGEYTYYDEFQDMSVIVAEQILTAHLRLTHNALWSIVEENEDGSKLWRNATGNEIPDPVAVKAALVAEIEALIAASTST